MCGARIFGRKGRKAKSVMDGKRKEMYVALGGGDYIAAVVLGKVFWCERVMIHLTGSSPIRPLPQDDTRRASAGW